MTDNLEQRAREMLAAEWGDHPQFAKIVERIRSGSCSIHCDPVSLSCGVALRAITSALKGQPASSNISASDAFDMGHVWAQGLVGQTLEDSRAIGRTLYQDIFAPIATQIAAEIEKQGFNSFETADLGICAAKRIIRAALSQPASSGWEGIATLPGTSRDEIIVMLRDGTVRTAARGLGTILLGPYGITAASDNWPVRWQPLPSPPEPAAPELGHE